MAVVWPNYTCTKTSFTYWREIKSEQSLSIKF